MFNSCQYIQNDLLQRPQGR